MNYNTFVPMEIGMNVVQFTYLVSVFNYVTLV